jgi:RNA polymerase sigma-70 factor (ECF subfamily)
VAAVRLAIESRRGAAHGNEESDAALLEAADLGADPELACVRHMYKEDFAAAFREAMAALSSRERNVLRMSHLDGLSIDQIGAVYRVHRATAARWIARAQETLLLETRQRLVDKLRISETEFESLMVLVRSHLDLSLHRFLGPGSKG